MGNAAWIGFIFLLIGIVFTLFALQFNLGGIRSAYISPNGANRIDVINWLTNEIVGENIEYGNVSSPGTIKAMAALGFAYELDPKNAGLITSLEQIIRDIQRITRPRDVSFGILNNNLSILEEIYKYVPYRRLTEEASSLKVRVLTQQLELQAHDPQVSDSLLLSGYRNLWQNYKSQIDTNLTKKTIENLNKSILDFEQLKALNNSDTTTISQRFNCWQNFVSLRRDSPEKSFGSAEISRMNEMLKEYASIADEDKFFACRSVIDLNPHGRADRFSPGNICAWAQVRAPRNEQVYFKWYANGEHYHTFSVRVDHNLEPGYRVHSAKNYGAEYRGQQEVRLYNSQNQLIGRRVFYVG